MTERKPQFLAQENVERFLAKFLKEKLFCTVERHGVVDLVHVREADELSSVRLAAVRPARTLRNVLLPVRELVATYFGGGGPRLPAGEAPTIVVGARACDLQALAALDALMVEEELQDPFYKARRDALVLVSVDCSVVGPYCFCNMVGGRPYCEAGSDLNLTPIEGGFLVEAFSEKGVGMASQVADVLQEATEAQLAERDRVHTDSDQKLAEQNIAFAKKPLDVDDFVDKALEESPVWGRHAADCVECGACTNVCPTCYCFFMFDQMHSGEGGQFERVRTWDSCMYADYAKMAGVGGMKPDPRPLLENRFRNRVLHKYAYYPQTYRRFACVGCGRCIEGCMGGIDLRQVVSDLGAGK